MGNIGKNDRSVSVPMTLSDLERRDARVPIFQEDLLTHTSAKAADVAKSLLLNKRRVTRPLMRSMAVMPPNANRNATPNTSHNVT